MLIDNYCFTKNEQFDHSIWRNQKPQIGQIITESQLPPPLRGGGLS